MKKMILIILIMVMLVTGCSKVVDDTGNINIQKTKIITLDGCQYITVENSFDGAQNYSFAITHKGNCNNKIHDYR